MERGGGLGGWTAEMTCSHDITSLFVSDAADKREVMEGCSDWGGVKLLYSHHHAVCVCV